ncbi:MAG TPA: penicillin-binding transpeptidase domain-containing protein [Clostridiales bacterium]|nr:penicillin-binding transpeptidase domain-containing protein [Clostridiales bacterium]
MEKRIRLIILFFIVFGVAVLARVIWLQAFCHDDLAAKADSQEISTVELAEEPRGTVYDRHNIAITADRETLALLIVPALIDDVGETASALEENLGFSAALLQNKTAGKSGNGKTIRKTPFVAKTDLTTAEAETVEALKLNGVYVVSRQGRYYRDYPALHLLGALGEESGNEAGDTGVTVGLSGLEKVYEDILHNSGGKKIGFLVDENNKIIESGAYFLLEDSESAAGELYLTLDLDIQRAAEAAIGANEGAVVVMDAENGDILALVSSPKYDPYQVTENTANDVYVNKALSAYPPASLFKIFLAATALDEGVVQPETSFFCDGSYTLGNGQTISCWKEEGHGFLTFEESLSLSCNPVFVRTALSLGKSRMEEAFARWELKDDYLLGYPLNDLSGLDLAGGGEADLANAALGEKGVMMTPVNIAKMINVIAANGLLYTPRIVQKAVSEKGDTVASYDTALALRVISAETASTVKEMMAKTFENGTAQSLHLEDFKIAGKTGTSETGNVWIGGFFPYDDPKYTVVILVTGGSSGVGDGGPIMKKLCAYLENEM